MDSKNQDDRICTSRRRFLKQAGSVAIASLPLGTPMVFAGSPDANRPTKFECKEGEKTFLEVFLKVKSGRLPP